MVSPPPSIEAQLTNLEEKGRGIYFYHDNSVDLPVRDITDKGKMEPHIEYGSKNGLNDEYVVGAENYCYSCYQKAVKKLIESNEKYLFLLTTPQNRNMERQIVGYIRKDDYEVPEEDRVAVVGKTMFYSFDNSIPASEMGKRTKAPLGAYGETFDEDETEEIISHFDSCDDVTEACLQKVRQLQEGEGDDSRNSSGC